MSTEVANRAERVKHVVGQDFTWEFPDFTLYRGRPLDCELKIECDSFMNAGHRVRFTNILISIILQRLVSSKMFR